MDQVSHQPDDNPQNHSEDPTLELPLSSSLLLLLMRNKVCMFRLVIGLYTGRSGSRIRAWLEETVCQRYGDDT